MSELAYTLLVSWFKELNCHHQKGGDCRSKDFALDILMMPYVRDVLMPYEKRFSSLIQDKNPRIQDTRSRRSLVF